MKTDLPIGIHCRITPDRIVLPENGYEAASIMEDQGYRGKAKFQVLAGRTTEPPMVICEPVPQSVRPIPVIEYNPVINFAFFNYSFWRFDSGAWSWRDEDRKGVFGADGPAAMPNNYYHIDLGRTEDPPLTGNGLNDPFTEGTFIKNAAYTMFDPATLNGWKIRSLNFFRWKGEPGNPADYPYGLRNVKVPGTATVEFDIWKRTYDDAAAPAAVIGNVFHETKSYVIDASGGTVGDGVPSAITFVGFSNAEIDSFASLTITDSWPQTKYGSGNLKEHFYPKTVRFSVVP